jgi:signal peptidase I
MDEEKTPSTSEQISPVPLPSQFNANADGSPQEIMPESAREGVTQPALPPVRPLPDGLAIGPAEPAPLKRSVLRLIIGWFLVLLSIFIVGNVIGFAAAVFLGPHPFASFLAAIFTYILSAVLDNDGSLSKFYGIQTTPNSSPLRSVLYFLTFGWIAFLFIRRPAPQTAPAKQASTDAQAGTLPQPPASAEPKDVYREVAETVVFVVVLVLLLKTFIAEAFVIPTGSMATTLWGYQKYVQCPNCGFSFPVNCSSEGDPQSVNKGPVTHCECPNCRYGIDLMLELEGKCVSAANGQLRVEYSEWYWKTTGRDPIEFQFPIDNKTIITVDGKPGSLEEIRPETPVRVIFHKPPRDLRDFADRPAVAITAAADGSFPPRDKFLVIDPGYHSGDRVLVFKALYDTGMLRDPQRHDVVVFKYPVEPQKMHQPMNYIKRLMGLPGETIAIRGGQIYVCKEPRDVTPPDHHWAAGYAPNYDWPKEDKEAERLWNEGKFEIDRKPPGVILAMRRIVYDNDYLPENTQAYPIRWKAERNWTGDGDFPKSFKHDGDASSLDWLRYRNILSGGKQAELITDFMGYNSSDSPMSNPNGANWVGDLMLECELKVEKAAGEVVLELSKGSDRFQARFDLATGNCTLLRQDKELPLRYLDADSPPATKPTKLKQPGTYHVRFANFDETLTLWVNDELPFGAGVSYAPPKNQRPTRNDLEPASIGCKGTAVSVAHLQLWRDTYYTTMGRGEQNGDFAIADDARHDPDRWAALSDLKPFFMYIHPGHYLCLGDNSPASSDGRTWGMVPERLMLGRALVVYFPFYCPYWPINAPTNRIGPIR